MLVNSTDKLPVYQVLGRNLRIHWNYQEVPATEDMPASWSCEEVCVLKTADRATIISAIIRTRYAVDDEFAAINNGGEDYQALLDFRVEAKALADGWLANDQNG